MLWLSSIPSIILSGCRSFIRYQKSRHFISCEMLGCCRYLQSHRHDFHILLGKCFDLKGTKRKLAWHTSTLALPLTIFSICHKRDNEHVSPQCWFLLYFVGIAARTWPIWPMPLPNWMLQVGEGPSGESTWKHLDRTPPRLMGFIDSGGRIHGVILAWLAFPRRAGQELLLKLARNAKLSGAWDFETWPFWYELGQQHHILIYKDIGFMLVSTKICYKLH